MAARGLLGREAESRALRLLRRPDGRGKGFRTIWKKVETLTVRFVLQQPRVKERIQEHRHAVVGGGLRPVRGDVGNPRASRIAEVGIYDYDRDVLLVAVVDLRKGTLLDIEERKGLQPQLSPAELADAKTLVLSSGAYRSLVRERALQVNAFPARVSFLDGHPAYGHRAFTLVFWSGGRTPRKLRQVVVDLSRRELLDEDADDDAVMKRLADERSGHGPEGA